MTTTCALPRQHVAPGGWPGALGLAAWLGAGATLFLLACWLLGLRLELDLTTTHSLEISGRALHVYLWPTPRSSGDPDTWTLPLWLPLAATALPTALLACASRLLAARRAP